MRPAAERGNPTLSPTATFFNVIDLLICYNSLRAIKFQYNTFTISKITGSVSVLEIRLKFQYNGVAQSQSLKETETEQRFLYSLYSLKIYRMLEYNKILPKKVIVFEGEPYVVLTSVISKKSRQQASNQTKIKNLITGKVTSQAFHQTDKLEEAEIEKRDIKYLYSKQGLPAGRQGEYWFCDSNNPRNRFFLSDGQIGDQVQYLKENTVVEALLFQEDIFGISLPPKLDLKVIEAPPSIRGNTATGGNKPVVVETGATVSVPLFIETGDVIRVNTETGDYAERVGKG